MKVWNIFLLVFEVLFRLFVVGFIVFVAFIEGLQIESGIGKIIITLIITFWAINPVFRLNEMRED